MKADEDLQAWKCHFTFTKADSEEYLRKFGNGSGLWCTDILVDKVKAIKRLSAFAPRHFRKAYELMALKGSVSKNEFRTMLKEKNIQITSKASFPIFTEIEKQDIVKKWNEGDGHKFLSRIVTRKMITLNDSKVKDEKPNIDISHISHIEMLRTIQTGRLAPEGFDARRVSRF